MAGKDDQMVNMKFTEELRKPKSEFLLFNILFITECMVEEKGVQNGEGRCQCCTV